MRRLIAIAVLLGMSTTLAAQQPAAPPARPAQGVPGGGPENGMNQRPPNGEGQKPAFPGQTRAPEQKLNVAFTVVTVAEGLQNPWSLAFLPSGKMLVTERPGRLRVVSADGTLSEPVAGLPPVDARGQGGLLDVALDPAFAKNNLIYWSFAEPKDGKANNTAVARGKFVDDATAPRVEDVQVIYHQTPSLVSPLHFGGRLIFGRDGTLFITQGDRSITEGRMQAQKMDSGLGKIVRINTDGSIPKDNPFVGKEGVRPEIWSFGHRNVQSAAIHPTTGELWEVEHGTRGGDEINIARKGKDYGWPTIAYGIEYQGGPITGGIQQQAGMEQPLYYWDPVIAPSGMMFYTGNLFPEWRNSLFVGGLGSLNLVRLTIKDERVVGEERLLQDLQPSRARIRDVRQGPDGAVYVLTDSPKGRLLKLIPGSAPAQQPATTQPAASAAPQPYFVGNRLGLPINPAPDGKFDAISSNVKVYGAIYSAESCSYDPVRGVIVVPNRGVGQNVQANNAWISFLNHDGSVHTARWVGIQNPGTQRTNSNPPLVLNEPFGSDIVNGTLYLADRDGGTGPGDPAINVIRRFNMQTGAPAGETRIEKSTGFNDIAVTANGTIYGTVTGSGDGAQLWKVMPDGTASILVQGVPLVQPNGVALDPQGNIVVVNIGNPDVITFSADGKVVRTEKAAQSGNDGLVIMPDGTKYVSSVILGGVSRIRPGQAPELIAQNIPSAASMCYDAGANQLVIPMNANNALAFIPLR